MASQEIKILHLINILLLLQRKRTEIQYVYFLFILKARELTRLLYKPLT